MFSKPTKKNRDIFICLLVIIISSLLAVRSYNQIRSNREVVTIKIPFNQTPQTFYGFYSHNNQCFGFIKIEKNFAVDLSVNVLGKLRVSIDNNTTSLGLSAGVVVNSLGQIAFSNFNIKDSDKTLFAFSTKNVNPIEITVFIPNDQTSMPIQTSLQGPMMFTKASSQQYILSVPFVISRSNRQNLEDGLAQSFPKLLSGLKITEHPVLPADCQNEHGIAIDLSVYLRHFQELIQTQFNLTPMPK